MTMELKIWEIRSKVDVITNSNRFSESLPRITGSIGVSEIKNHLNSCDLRVTDGGEKNRRFPNPLGVKSYF